VLPILHLNGYKIANPTVLARIPRKQLTEHVAKMSSAPEGKKMSLMAALITHMVEQRIAMDARKAKMEEGMMKHMMQHMQMGKDSISQCPMMKGMKDMDDKSAGAHKEPQEEQK
jgi:phosphoketolase